MVVKVITVSACMLLIIGFATQMESIAQETAGKAIDFSEDMNDAMDCAVRGIPISVCSPTLMQHDFTEQREEFEQAMQEMQEALEGVQVIDDEGQEVIVI